MLTLRQALIVGHGSDETTKVQHLDIPKSGNARIKALLTLDFKEKKVDRNALRTACGGISSQAVSNWLATGTISKENLDIVSTFTGRPVEQYLRVNRTRLNITIAHREPPLSYRCEIATAESYRINTAMLDSR